MTVYVQALTNPGAEAGTTTGWTNRGAGTLGVNTTNPHAGSWRFVASTTISASNSFDQEITVDAALFTGIDNNQGAAIATAWHNTSAIDSDSGALYLEFYDTSHVLLLRKVNEDTGPNAWTQESTNSYIPANTRYIRIGTTNTRVVGSENSNYWDDFTLTLSDDRDVDYPGVYNPKALQLGVYSLAGFSAEQTRGLQLGDYALAASETSTGLFNQNAHQLGVYALVKGLPRRTLRAWTFTQDDHDFYVLNLGDDLTLVYDKLTGQWCQWRSPTYNYWRGADGCFWEGYNLCCDPLTGKIWKIDPDGRLDYTTTPITSQVTGMLTERFRTHVPCYMAELALSEGQPPSGVDAGEVTIQLRTNDGLTWTDHGTVASTSIGEDITVRWYGLGLMKSPEHVFEITDTGYARRIDGFNIKVPDNSG
jgi:hypothetical protein